MLGNRSRGTTSSSCYTTLAASLTTELRPVHRLSPHPHEATPPPSSIMVGFVYIVYSLVGYHDQSYKKGVVISNLSYDITCMIYFIIVCIYIYTNVIWCNMYLEPPKTNLEFWNLTFLVSWRVAYAQQSGSTLIGIARGSSRYTNPSETKLTGKSPQCIPYMGGWNEPNM